MTICGGKLLKMRISKILLIILLFASCLKSSRKELESIVYNKIESLEVDKNLFQTWKVECDSVEFLLGLNPTFLREYYDTIVEQTLNECDFAVVFYTKKEREFYRVSCEELKFNTIDFEKTSFIKGDEINFELYNCYEIEPFKQYCSVKIK